MASFQAKISWKRPRKRENKICHSIPFRSSLTRNRKFQKRMARKLKNLKKNHYGFISIQNRLEKAEKERK